MGTGVGVLWHLLVAGGAGWVLSTPESTPAAQQLNCVPVPWRQSHVCHPRCIPSAWLCSHAVPSTPPPAARLNTFPGPLQSGPLSVTIFPVPGLGLSHLQLHLFLTCEP